MSCRAYAPGMHRRVKLRGAIRHHMPARIGGIGSLIAIVASCETQKYLSEISANNETSRQALAKNVISLEWRAVRQYADLSCAAVIERAVCHERVAKYMLDEAERAVSSLRFAEVSAACRRRQHEHSKICIIMPKNGITSSALLAAVAKCISNNGN